MKNIKMIVLDVDGTLTDGKLYYDSLGNEMKAFNVKDGMAIGQAIKNGINISIITGRESEIVNKRGKELGVEYIFQGVHNKLEKLQEIVINLKLDLSEVMFIGDDINDLEIMKFVGISACPLDAVDEVIEISDLVSKYTGGNGAVREIIQKVLVSQGKWENIILKYSGNIQ